MTEPVRQHPISVIRRDGDAVVVLDQTRLPHDIVELRLENVEAMCEAIRALRVRGAPLLGICGAYGMALAGASSSVSDGDLSAAASQVKATRPTAVDLGRAVDRALAQALAAPSEERANLLWRFADDMLAGQRALDEALGEHGAALLGGERSILTHCNTGALATGGVGTALSVIAALHQQGRLAACYATETRPLLQGGRLTAWELVQMGANYRILPDGAAASLIASGAVDAVITGADRVAANGDSANKIGTYALALAAKAHGVPFFIAAPLTTIDLECPSGADIPIEFRDEAEVRGWSGTLWAPADARAWNPAFDVTPASLIAGIITERGVVTPPYEETLRAIAAGGAAPAAGTPDNDIHD